MASRMLLMRRPLTGGKDVQRYRVLGMSDRPAQGTRRYPQGDVAQMKVLGAVGRHPRFVNLTPMAQAPSASEHEHLIAYTILR
jgi:hypothetical protein